MYPFDNFKVSSIACMLSLLVTSTDAFHGQRLNLTPTEKEKKMQSLQGINRSEFNSSTKTHFHFFLLWFHRSSTPNKQRYFLFPPLLFIISSDCSNTLFFVPYKIQLVESLIIVRCKIQSVPTYFCLNCCAIYFVFGKV